LKKQATGWKCFDHDEAVYLVIDFLRNRRFEILNIKHKNATGFDLTIHNGTRAFNVEVKALKKRKEAFSFRTEHIYEPSRKADFMAVVFPDGYIFLEKMEDFLKCADKRGQRNFTEFLIPLADE